MQPHELSPAVEAFSLFLARIEDGESVNFDEFCADHAQYEPELRQLHSRWSSMADAFGELATDTGQSRGSGPELESSALLARLGETNRCGDRYTDYSEIARGGMGTILRVWDKELRRSLAMKVMTDANASSRQVSRFLDEAQVTGQLDHPGIVPVHEIGIDGDGRLYYTMPLIKGRDFKTIIELVHSADEEWSLHRALSVLVHVAEAMAYAHSKGVIHRDLKPANIMVAPFGETYVMDWGLARARGSMALANPKVPDHDDVDPDGSIQTDRREVANESDDSPLLTSEGDVVGTPAYMPPEQARGEIERLSVRSDVYSAGAILYHLLTGHVPFSSSGDRAPSHMVLEQLLKRSPEPLRELRPELPPELAAICERAMAREPEDRFGEMIEFADNLRAFLEGRVVRAYESGAIAELRKWVVRNRWLASASAAGVVFLVVGFLVSTSLFFVADAQAKRADASAAHMESELSASNVARGRLLAVAGNLGTAENLIWREHLRGRDHRHSHWALWELYSRHPLLAAMPSHDLTVYRVRTLADGSILSAGKDGIIKQWKYGESSDPTALGEHGASVHALAVSPDEGLLASGGADGNIVLWDLRTGKLLRKRAAHQHVVTSLAFGPDGQRLFSSSHDKRVLIEDVRSGALSEFHEYELPVYTICVDPKGERIAATTEDGVIHISSIDRPGEVQLLRGHVRPVEGLVFGHSGQKIYSGSWDGTIRIWDSASGHAEILQTRNGAVRELALSRDGKTIFGSGWWHIDEWDLETLQRQRSFGIPRHSWGLDLTHDEGHLVSGHEDGVIRLWDLRPDRGVRRLVTDTERATGIISADGKTFATGDKAGDVWLWDLETGKRLFQLGAHDDRVKTLVFSPSGSILATGGMDQKVRLWHVEDRRLLHTFDNHWWFSSHSIAFDPSGETIALACSDEQTERAYVAVHDVESGELLQRLDTELPQVLGVQFDASGDFLATSERYPPPTKGDVIHIWRRSGELYRTIPVVEPWSVLFHPDGRRVLVGNWAKEILLIDIETGRIERTMSGHGGTVWSLAISPGNPGVLASGSADETVRLWDIDTGRNLVVLPGHTGGASRVSISADGQTLGASSSSNFVLLHDLAYFDRHVAGNLETQAQHFRSELGSTMQMAELLEWQRRDAAKPWPRFR